MGEASPRPIVCGAWNFAAGDTVAVALPGTVLLDGRRIARSKLRGETSDGMILSERELDISSEGEGIIVLGDGWRPGEPLATRIPLAHDVLELEVTSNRADLLSMRGVARDVHAIFGIELSPLDESEPPALGDRLTADWIAISIEDEELCPRFTARVFQDVTVGPLAALAQGASAARPACGRSRTSSTSPTTSCTTSAARCTPTTTRTCAELA